MTTTRRTDVPQERVLMIVTAVIGAAAVALAVGAAILLLSV